MQISELKYILKEFGANVRYEHDLKKKNWFNIGGKTKVFYKADNLKDLVNLLKKLKKKEKIFVLGAGSNTLIKDELFDGVVIKLSKNFNNISLLGENTIIAGSAVLDKSLSDFAMKNDLTGFEFLSCIPGTIGGGIRMNASCFGKEFKDILLSIQAIDKSGKVISIPSKDIKFEYRKSNLSDDLIFLSASFKGVKDDYAKIKENTDKLKLEKEIEGRLAAPITTRNASGIGKAFRIDSASGRYIEYCKSTLKGQTSLKDKTILVDAANGANYKITPMLLTELGAKVIKINCDPDGFNINEDCAVLKPELFIREYNH